MGTWRVGGFGGWKLGEDKYEESIGAALDLDSGRRVHGRITLHEKNRTYASTTKIFDDKSFNIPSNATVHGISERGAVSLLRCYGGESFGGPWPLPMLTSCNLRSRLAVFGNKHVTLDDEVIRGVEFTLGYLDAILERQRRRDTFGFIIHSHDKVLEAIEEHQDLPSGSLRKNAWITYFTGKHDLMPAADTVLGTVRVLQSVHARSGGESLQGRPYIRIDFDSNPTTIDGALHKVRMLHEFFSWIVGYTSRWNDVIAFTERQREKGHRKDQDGNIDTGLSIFTRDPGGSEPLDWYYLLIDPVGQSRHLSNVMKEWLARSSDDNRRKAHDTFFASMPGMSRKIIEDQIVAAGNMFEYLPVADRGNTRAKMFDVAKRRARRLRPLLHSRLPHLEQVVETAIACRDHFTHGEGGSKKPDHGVDFSTFDAKKFLTDTLLFTYSIAELLDCGWDLQTWLDSDIIGPDWHHPFAHYLRSYDQNLSLSPHRFAKDKR